MTLTYQAHFHDVTFIHKGKKKSTGLEYEKTVKVLNFNLKSVCLALADHANDEGEGAYPAVGTIQEKTELSYQTVISCLTAMKQEGILARADKFSKWGTVNYTIKKEKLIEMAGWERQKREKPQSKAALFPDVKPLDFEGKAALHKPSLHPKPSLIINGNEEKKTPITEPTEDEVKQMAYDLVAQQFNKNTRPYLEEFYRLTGLLPVGKKPLKEWIDACGALWAGRLAIEDMEPALTALLETNFSVKNPGSLQTTMQTIKMRREKNVKPKEQPLKTFVNKAAAKVAETTDALAKYAQENGMVIDV